MSEQAIAAEPVVLPYYVVDAWLDRVLRGLAEAPRWPLKSARATLSSGSMRYVILNRKGIVMGRFDITAVADNASFFEAYVSLSLSEQEQKAATLALNGIFSGLLEYFKLGTVQAIRINEILDSVRDIAIPETAQEGATAKRGPKPDKVNEWARGQATEGHTIDEILPEYARRRRMKPVEARELLRKALNRK